MDAASGEQLRGAGLHHGEPVLVARTRLAWRLAEPPTGVSLAWRLAEPPTGVSLAWRLAAVLARLAWRLAEPPLTTWLAWRLTTAFRLAWRLALEGVGGAPE